MHKELIDALSVITEEEQRILNEQKGIDRGSIQEKRSWLLIVRSFYKKES